MGQPKAKKPRQNKRRAGRRGLKLKTRTKDLDQIHELINDPAKLEKFQKEIEEDAKDPECEIPGRGQFPCITCAMFFQDQTSLDGHMRSKKHKKRLKQLRDEPYSIEEAEAASGLGRYKAPDLKRTKVIVGVLDDGSGVEMK